jgi:glc operon protein GlcG
MQLSYTDAQKIIAVILAELEKDNLGAAVAVVDAHGELLAFVRTDTCPLPSIQIAQNKAFSSARQRQESGVIGQKAREKHYPVSNFGDPRFVGWGGGIPILVDDVVIGAVGVSGLPEEQDIVLAKLGASVING